MHHRSRPARWACHVTTVLFLIGFDVAHHSAEAAASARVAASRGFATTTAVYAPATVGQRRSDEDTLRLDGDSRRLIQLGLRNEGFDPGPIDGVFGPATRAAIRRWQAAQGQQSTGYLDASTAAILRIAGTAPVATARVQQDSLFWDSIRNSTDPADFQAYLSQFPGGAFAELARRREAALGGPRSRPASDRQVAQAPPALQVPLGWRRATPNERQRRAAGEESATRADFRGQVVCGVDPQEAIYLRFEHEWRFPPDYRPEPMSWGCSDHGCDRHQGFLALRDAEHVCNVLIAPFGGERYFEAELFRLPGERVVDSARSEEEMADFEAAGDARYYIVDVIANR